MKKEIQRIEKRLQTIKKELEKVRDYSVLNDGWQTQKFAKKSRKYDFLALEKFDLIKKLTELNLSFGFHLQDIVLDSKGFEFFIVSMDDFTVCCDFKGNEGDVFEFKYYELTQKYKVGQRVVLKNGKQ